MGGPLLTSSSNATPALHVVALLRAARPWLCPARPTTGLPPTEELDRATQRGCRAHSCAIGCDVQTQSWQGDEAPTLTEHVEVRRICRQEV